MVKTGRRKRAKMRRRSWLQIIYGDFLFGETGPIASDLDELLQTYGTDRRDEPSAHAVRHFKADVEHGEANKALNHAWPDLVRFGIGHVPFGNLIYLKGALDYLLWYHIYEAISPGWWERTNRRLQKEQGRTMVGYTPGGSIPLVPFGLSH
jgi:hypothetical protein